MKKFLQIFALIIFLLALQGNSYGASVTKGLIGAQDLHNPDGTTTRTFTRSTSAGYTMTLNDVGHEVDALITYGGGVNYTQATIASALTAIGTTNLTTLLLRPGTWVISSNADWSAYTNVTFKIVPGAQISKGSYTLLFDNWDQVNAGWYQIFSGTGVVTATNGGTVKSAWWGGGAAAVQAAQDSMAAAVGGTVLLPSGTIAFGTTTVNVTAKGLTIRGQSYGGNNNEYTIGTRITYTGTNAAFQISVATLVDANQAYHTMLEKFMIDGLNTGAEGIRVGTETTSTGHLILRDIYITKTATTALALDHVNWLHTYNSHFSYNDGNGVEFKAPNGAEAINIVTFNGGSIDGNGTEGVLINLGGDIVFNSVEIGLNDNEGIKVTTGGSRIVGNITINNCWFESNQADTARVNGYYQILMDSTTPGTRYVGRVTLNNNSMRGVTGPSTDGLATKNGQMYIVANEVTINGNAYASYGASIIKPWSYVNAITATFTGGETYDSWKWGTATRIAGTFTPYNIATAAGKSTSGTGEDTLESFTLIKDRFTNIETNDVTELTRQQYQQGGRFNTFHIVAYGNKTNGSTENKTIKLYFGSTVIGQITTVTDTLVWKIEAWAHLVDAGAGTWHYNSVVINGTTITAHTYAEITEAITSNILIKTTGEVAATGTDVITQYLLRIE